MRLVQLAYAAVYVVTVIVFGVCALALAGFAVLELVQALSPSPEQAIRARFDRVLEAIGLLRPSPSRRSSSARPSSKRKFSARPR